MDEKKQSYDQGVEWYHEKSSEGTIPGLLKELFDSIPLAHKPFFSKQAKNIRTKIIDLAKKDCEISDEKSFLDGCLEAWAEDDLKKLLIARNPRRVISSRNK